MLLRARCQGKTKEGKSCRAPATAGGLCYFHANPDQARILGRKGGRKNRYQVTEVVSPENVTAASLGTVLDQALGELLAGRLDPRVATAAAQLVNTRRRITETIDLERRVTKLELKLADSESADAEAARVPEEAVSLQLGKGSDHGNGGYGNGNNGKA